MAFLRLDKDLYVWDLEKNLVILYFQIQHIQIKIKMIICSSYLGLHVKKPLEI